MIEGWLVYNKEDYEKNTFFIHKLIGYGKDLELNIKFFLREDLLLGVSEKGLYVQTPTEDALPRFVINRTRDALFAEQMELLGVKVFNNGKVTEWCNNKLKTHQLVNHLGIPSVSTFFWDNKYHTFEQVGLSYPIVIKTVDGHGGSEVSKVDTPKELEERLKKEKRRYLVLQEMCSLQGVDIRVFVVGDKILAAIKRTSTIDFRSNFSLGGGVKLIEVEDKLANMIYKILNNLKCDCVGIDFMVDKDGNFLFNEIEDVVGSRSLYKESDIDLALEYIKHIKNTLV